MNDPAAGPAPACGRQKDLAAGARNTVRTGKAHTREGDAIAAARLRLLMVEVDASIEVVGPNGPITILDVFEGRKQLIAYFRAWWPTCCRAMRGLHVLQQPGPRAVVHPLPRYTYAAPCKGPHTDSVRYREFLGLEMRGTRSRRRRRSSWRVVIGSASSGLLCPRRRAGVRDVLHRRSWRRDHVPHPRAAGDDCVRTSGGMGGLSPGLASAVG